MRFFAFGVKPLALAIALAAAILLIASPQQAHGHTTSPGHFHDRIHTVVLYAGEALSGSNRPLLPEVWGISGISRNYTNDLSPVPAGITVPNNTNAVRRINVSAAVQEAATIKFNWIATNKHGAKESVSVPISLTVIPRVCADTGAWRPSNWSSLSNARKASLKKECDILLSVRKVWQTAGSGSLPNWSKDTSIHNWTGITLSGSANQTVTRITLGGLGLKGGLPGQMGGLDGLTHLSIAQNPDLAGSIPPEIGDMGSLEFLNLHGNGLTGAIPAGMTDANSLKRIYLHNNSLTGDIPSEFTTDSNDSNRGTPNLETLYLYGNNLGNTDATKVFPANTLFASSNGLTKLKRLHLGGNNYENTAAQITGLGNLTDLEVLSLRDNKMSGDIMDDLAKLTKLKILNLENNDKDAASGFSGDLSKLKTLTALTHLKLSNNDFAGSNGLHSDLKALTNLRVFELRQDTSGGSRITGAVSGDLSALVNLRVLDLHGQNLSGSLPNMFGSMSYLQVLNLADNNMSGGIPASIGSAGLNKLDLSNNGFTGAIPKEIGNLRYLLRLYLDHNDLEGPMPAELAKLDLLPWGLRLEGNTPNVNASGKTPLPGFSLSAEVVRTSGAKDIFYEGDFDGRTIRVTVTPDAATQWASKYKPLKATCDDRQPNLVDDPATVDVNESCLLDPNDNVFQLRIKWRQYDPTAPSGTAGHIAQPLDDSSAGHTADSDRFATISPPNRVIDMPFAGGATSKSYDFTITPIGAKETQKLRFYLWAGYQGHSCTDGYRCHVPHNEPTRSDDSGGIMNGVIGAYTHDRFKTGLLQTAWVNTEITLQQGQRPAGLILPGLINPVLTPTPTPTPTPEPTPTPTPVSDNFDGQVWEVQHVTDDSTSCLDVSYGDASNGQDVWMWKCNDTDAQKWRFEKRTAGDYKDSYRLVSTIGSDTHCLDNRGDFTTGDRMGVWQCVDDTHGAAPNQSVTIEPSGDGYTITFVRNSDSKSVWLVTDRASDDVYGGANQSTVSGSPGADAIWRIVTPD